MQRLWNWLKGLRVVEYRLSEEDRERMDALQFHNAGLLDEIQALCLEMSATRQALEVIAEELRDINGGIQKAKGRATRRSRSADHQDPCAG